MSNYQWTREQTIVALNVYFKISFQMIRKTHPIIIEYAKYIDRSPSALNMKLANFGRFDPDLKERGILGLSHGSKLDKIIWDEFYGKWEELTYESEIIISKFQKKTIEDRLKIDLSNIPQGKERERVVSTRINQSFFRSIILSSYNEKCCITGLSIPDILVASHIIPWSKNEKERLNPSNGLCLNSIHDQAFDKGYITISQDFKVILSKKLTDAENDDAIIQFFIKYNSKKISLPERFLPDSDFLDYHQKNIFLG